MKTSTAYNARYVNTLYTQTHKFARQALHKLKARRGNSDGIIKADLRAYERKFKWLYVTM